MTTIYGIAANATTNSELFYAYEELVCMIERVEDAIYDHFIFGYPFGGKGIGEGAYELERAIYGEIIDECDTELDIICDALDML
jgi:hypothetical protein